MTSIAAQWPDPWSLPEFPWDRLEPYRVRAPARGLIDLSIGTPVDATPDIVQGALRDASDAHGYPTVWGTPELRDAAAGWLRRCHGVQAIPDAILPTIGSKELVAALPFQLGLTDRDVISIPAIAYPTYDIGARIAHAGVVLADGVEELEAARVRVDAAGRSLRMVWLNSPSNPTGAVLSKDELRDIVTWGRTHGILIVNDECYIELGWDVTPISMLHPDVCGTGADAHDGLLVVHSLSKRSNLAGYRGAFITGDAALIKRLLEFRKHTGYMVPMPVQCAETVAYADDAHAVAQRARYARRRELLRSALGAAGYRVESSHAGLYLWTTRDEDCWITLGRLADLGILCAPGAFYGAAGERHVRIALTGTDADIEEATSRLADVHGTSSRE